MQHYSNLQAVAQKLSGGNAIVQQQMVDYGNAYVAPGLQYCHNKFSGEPSESVAAFKAARLVSPQKIVEIQPNAQDKDAMKCFPFLKGTLIDNLKQELPVYLAKAENFDEAADPLQWWMRYSKDLPYWSTPAEKVLLKLFHCCKTLLATPKMPP